MTEITFRSDSTVELVQSNASDELVARAAWVSNIGSEARVKESGRIPGLISFLWRNKHTSPFEHGQFTFFIETPIFVAREFMRHRTWSYNEWSARYSELEPVFFCPSAERPLQQTGKIGEYKFIEGTIAQEAIVNKGFIDSYQSSWQNYQEMLAAGVAKEIARDVLPVATYTKFFASVNPLNLMRFLDLRADVQALEEIRNVAYKLRDIFEEQMPITASAWRGSRD